MSNPVQKAIYDFESYSTSNLNNNLSRLIEISDKLIELNHPDIPERLIRLLYKYLSDPLLSEKYKIPYILNIVSKYKNNSILNELIELSANPKIQNFEKELCKAIGSYKNDYSRKYLKKMLNSSITLYAALQLSEYHDLDAEPVLFSHFKNSLDQMNFSSDIYFALVNLKSTRIWFYIDHYLLKAISEKERYKVCNCLLNTKDSHITSILIKCYKYYEQNPDIPFSDVKSISLEGKSLILNKIYKESKSFSEKMKEKIINVLNSYQFDLRVKTFLRRYSSKI